MLAARAGQGGAPAQAQYANANGGAMDGTDTAITRRGFVGAATCAAAVAAGVAAAAGRAYAAGADGAAPPAPATRTLVEPFSKPQVTTEQERLANAKRILVVVDYQVDFVSGGVFGPYETATAIEDALYDRVKSYQDAGDIVIYTMDTHPADDYANTREATVNPLHCDPATEGWQVYGRLRELLTPETAIMVKKGTYGAPDLPRVIQTIRDQGTLVESIEVAGVSTTCRVLHNAILLYNFFPELPIVFDERTTASYTDERTAEQLMELEAWGFIVKRA